MNLNELFLHHKGTRSYDDLERACGKALTSQRLQQIATTKPKRFPHAENIVAIAQALGVPQVVVVLAAAESLGLDVSRETPRLLQLLPAEASDLSDPEVEALAHLIRAFKEPAKKSATRPRLDVVHPLDPDLDNLPHDAEDPLPFPGRSTQKAARKRDKK